MAKAAGFHRDYNGKQPGDPGSAAAALLKFASIEMSSLRIVPGIDTTNAAEANDLAKIESEEKWKDICSANGS